MSNPLATTPAEVKSAISAAPAREPLSRVLMARPDNFTVEAAINPWMKTKSGRLNKVDNRRALTQWDAIRASYESIGITVEVIEAGEKLPDFCFCANQSFPFHDNHGRPTVILSRMKNASRAPEVPYYERWYSQRGWRVHELPQGVASFEGMGDAIWHPFKRIIFGGIGPRTAEEAWPEVSRLSGLQVIPLRLSDPRFYHLDTCLACLDASTALWIPAAFDEASRERLKAAFTTLLEVPAGDAANFACNAHCPDGRHVMIQKGSRATATALGMRKFEVIELDTGEFLKSGGSVFCLKLELP
jgi:N-dimethylarginine dimethylaminohydrolase